MQNRKCQPKIDLNAPKPREHPGLQAPVGLVCQGEKGLNISGELDKFSSPTVFSTTNPPYYIHIDLSSITLDGRRNKGSIGRYSHPSPPFFSSTKNKRRNGF
ncbi:hypothetical protein ElyMa_002818300 [Elysia marginata]|uniref:Uncharacterized protein n=1 Tax=Elysia marginata TaxID=1093978 RepID=A0AAV4HT77_9GAST|nr:hypothetical protein ElyMa_002818300 [Elysia marginata]